MRLARLALATIALFALGAVARAQNAVADFYKGKTISLIFGGSAGGGYDTDARLIARHLGRFIPGQPGIVVNNVPGARGLTSVNRLYANVPRDGSVMGVVLRGLLTAPWLNPQGVQYDVAKFSWLFSSSAEPGVAMVWRPRTPYTTADLREKEIVIGGAGDSSIIPQVFNYTAGTRFKLVHGYPGTNDLVLAMQRGEVEGIGYYSWSNIPSKNPTWLSENRIQILLQTSTPRLADLPGVPSVSELALSPAMREIQDIWLSPLDTARPFAMPPDVPPERVEAVRRAFWEMVKDPEFLADAKKTGVSVDPRPAEDLAALVKRIGSMPRDVIDEARKAVPE